MTKVSPSLLAADFLHLDSEIEMINRSEADWLHCDVMDGAFVPLHQTDGQAGRNDDERAF